MQFVVFFAVLAVVLVVPVMIGARLVDARNTSFGYCLLAVVILAAAAAIIDLLMADDLLAFVATAAIGATVLSAFWERRFSEDLQSA